MPATLRPLSRCRVPDLGQFREHCRLEVRRCMATLQADGWSGIDIAESVGASRSTLYRWRSGAELPDYAQFLALKSLAAECANQRKAG